ncbi:MAG: hypothetical protein U0525_03370 [Patescibacteria group bacterium]
MPPKTVKTVTGEPVEISANANSVQESSEKQKSDDKDAKSILPSGGEYAQVLASDGSGGSFWINDATIPSSASLTINSATIKDSFTVQGKTKLGAYTFPVSDGSQNQVLKTDGAGNLIWASDNDSSVGDTLDLKDLTSTGVITAKGSLKVGTYTLPSVDGSANQVLKKNGSGVLSWSDDSSGTSIGTTLSLTNLTVSGSLISNGTTTIGAFSLPSADGHSGQVLKTNGSGELAWSDDANTTIGNSLTLQTMTVTSSFTSWHHDNRSVHTTAH